MAKREQKTAATATIAVAVAEQLPAEAVHVTTGEGAGDESAEAVAKAIVAPQDHCPPKVGAREIMASFERSMEVTRARRLESLAKKFPEVASLIQIATK